MDPRPRATTELPVSLQRTPQPPMTLSRLAATSHAPHALPREPTSRAEPWATTRTACAHYRLVVTRAQIYAPLRTLPGARVPQVYEPRMRATRRPVRPRLTLTPASPRAAEPTGRHPHRSPRPCLDALPEHTRPSSPPLSTKLPPSSPTVRPAPRTRRVVPLPAWGRRPPPSHTGAGPDRMPIKMCRSREPATTAGPERARISAPAPHGGAGQPGPP